MIGWLKCRDAARLSSLALEGRLSLGERIALRLHLAICDGCANFRRQLEFIRKAIRELAAREP